jgi:hypothetical protein
MAWAAQPLPSTPGLPHDSSLQSEPCTPLPSHHWFQNIMQPKLSYWHFNIRICAGTVQIVVLSFWGELKDAVKAW